MPSPRPVGNNPRSPAQAEHLRVGANGHLNQGQDEQIRLATELTGLQQRLASLPVIEQSKGLLMGHYGVDADTAFAILRRWSTTTNTKLREVSASLVAAVMTDGDGSNARSRLRSAIARFE